VKGLRPEITKDTPPFYRDLMQLCWHSDPTQRPTAQELKYQFTGWIKVPSYNVKQQLKKAEEELAGKTIGRPVILSLFY